MWKLSACTLQRRRINNPQGYWIKRDYNLFQICSKTPWSSGLSKNLTLQTFGLIPICISQIGGYTCVCKDMYNMQWQMTEQQNQKAAVGLQSFKYDCCSDASNCITKKPSHIQGQPAAQKIYTVSPVSKLTQIYQLNQYFAKHEYHPKTSE